MLIELNVEKSTREYAVNSACLVTVDPAVMERQHIKEGDLLRVATFWRELWVRVGAPEEEDRGTNLIRLDRFQRQSLNARVHEKVEVSVEREHPVSRVRLQPAVDLSAASSHHIEEHLKEEMVHHKTPVSKGSVLFIHFHHSVAGTLYKVSDVENGPGVVTEETDVVLEDAPESFGDSLNLDVTFEDLGGLSQEIRLVKELIQLPLQYPGIYRQVGIQPPRGVIFYGPPGTGKTQLARAMANEVNAQFHYINGPEIIGSTYGQSEANLRKIFGEATHHAPSVIYIDEIDVLAPKRGQTGSHSDTRLVTQLLSLMDGVKKVDGVVVVATTNRLNAIDSALRRPGRFDRELYIGPPGEQGRMEILRIHTREMPLSAEAKAYLPELAAGTHGFVGADLMELCREAGLNALRRKFADFTTGRSLSQMNVEKVRIEKEDFETAAQICRPSASREALVTVPHQGYDAIGGYADVKRQLDKLIVHPLQSGGAAKSKVKRMADGIILTGPSGTGKTLLAKAAAKEAGVNLLVVNGPELFTKWLGETEESVRHVFTLARQLMPCIIFFDQIDALAPVRGMDTGSHATERVVNMLTAELDALESLGQIATIASTNRIDLVDPALLRPGRFGIKIAVRLPNEADRRDILSLYLKELLSDEAMLGELLESLMRRTEGLTAAELRSLSDFLRQEILKNDETQVLEALEGSIDFWWSTRNNRE